MSTIAFRRWPGRELDRVVRPVRPGNSGGGKGPDFWCAFEASEEGVIGGEPYNTRQDQGITVTLTSIPYSLRASVT